MTAEHKRRYASISRYIFLSMVIVPLVPFLISLGIGFTVFKNELTGRTLASVRRIASDHQRMIDQFLRERMADLQWAADTLPYGIIVRPDRFSALYRALKRKSDAFADLGVFDHQGLHTAYEGPYALSGKQYADAAWFKAVIAEGRYISDVFLGYRQVPHFIIAVKQQGDGENPWVLRATIDTRVFDDLVQGVRIGDSGEAYIVNADGIFQTRRRSGGDLLEADADTLPVLSGRAAVQTFIRKNHRGEPFVYATTRLKEKAWMLVVRQSRYDAFSALRISTYLIVSVAVIGGAVILAVAAVLTDRIVWRIARTETEKGRLEGQLVRAARLAELGNMAAGFAHEINNPLQIMKSEQALIQTILADLKKKREVPPSDDLAELEDSLHQIAVQIDRCSEITHAILAFGRKSAPETREVDLHPFVSTVTALIGKKAAVHGIRIDPVIEAGIPRVKGDPSQLQQVLLNLLNNAMDAVTCRHGAAGGRVDIRIRRAEDRTVEIAVSDNGCGIAPENMKNIFSPFFTTKPVGQGTGLGLSICFGIVQSMGGAMTVDSTPEQGTTFTVRLPAADSA